MASKLFYDSTTNIFAFLFCRRTLCYDFCHFPNCIDYLLIYDWFRLLTNLEPLTPILHANTEDPNTSTQRSEPSVRLLPPSPRNTATLSTPCTRTWSMILLVPSTWSPSMPDSNVMLSGLLEFFLPLSFCSRTTLRKACTSEFRPPCSNRATSTRLPFAPTPKLFWPKSTERQRRKSRKSWRTAVTAFLEPLPTTSRPTNSGCTLNFSELVFWRSWKRPALKWTRTKFTQSWRTGCLPNWDDRTLPHA